MTNLKLYITIIFSSALLIACSDTQENNVQTNDTDIIEEDMTGVEETVHENEYAKALEVMLEPGQQVPWHEGGPRVIYSQSDYSVRFLKNPEDTTSMMNQFSEGDIHWHNQNTHSVVNTGSTAVEYMVFMRTSTNLPDSSTEMSQKHLMDVQPGVATVELENDSTQVIHVELAAGEEIPLHTGTKRFVYSLSDYDIAFNDPNEENQNRSFETGDVHWHEGGQHSIENTGDTTAEFLLIEFMN